MRRIFMVIVFTFSFILLITGCSSENKEKVAQRIELNVSAAASLTDVAKELSAIYTKKNPNVTINYNFASSGTLQKQIEEGAPVDMFISASKAKMDALAEKELIIKNTRKNLVSNQVVLLVNQDSNIKGFNDLTKPEVAKVSIGEPETVPAGKYSKEVLASLNIWNKLQPKMILTKTVRQVLSYVETGNVDAGLVYKTDALLAKNSKIAAVAPEGSHKPIIYPVAVIKNSQNQEEAEKYISFLTSQDAAQVFTKYGFTPISS